MFSCTVGERPHLGGHSVIWTLKALRGPAVSPHLAQGLLSPHPSRTLRAALSICGAVVPCRTFFGKH